MAEKIKHIQEEEYDKSMNNVADSQIVVGTRQRKLIDPTTGEIIEVEQVTKRKYGQQHFWKCFPKLFIEALKKINTSETIVLAYLFEIVHPSTNYLLFTYDSVTEATKLSRPTVAKVLKKFKDANLIRMQSNGVWLLNPLIFTKGNDFKRSTLYDKYSEKDQTLKDK